MAPLRSPSGAAAKRYSFPRDAGQKSKRSKKNAAHVQSDQDYLTGESDEHVSKISFSPFEGKGAERGVPGVR